MYKIGGAKMNNLKEYSDDKIIELNGKKVKKVFYFVDFLNILC